MTGRIVIYNPNTRDIWPDEAKGLADAIQKLNKDFEVEVDKHERAGVGVTWFEVLRIVLLGGAFGAGKVFAEEIVKKIADIAVDWAKQRFKGRKSRSARPVYVSIYGPDGVVKSVVIKNAVDEPEDRIEEDRRLASHVKGTTNDAAKPLTGAGPTSIRTCSGQHRCPVCHEIKPCALGLCSCVGDVTCDSCLYVAEFGSKGAEIIEKAIGVARMLHDASNRASAFFAGTDAHPWASKEEARQWMNQAESALEELDDAIGRIQLRFKARSKGAIG